jgi:ABC-type multidrug transport system ATPase subunit
MRPAGGLADPCLFALEGVSKRWGDLVVLDDVDLQIPAGEIVGIAGGNGVGKTTLLRISTGVITPDEGSVSFRGVDIEEDLTAFQKEIGFLSAGDRGLYARLTVRQNLDFCAGLAGLSRSDRGECIARIVSEFDLEDLIERRVDRLSMGQRQRVRLAVTFLHEPKIVFLDEAKTSLDEAGVTLLNAALARLLAKGGAAFLASPEPSLPFPGVSWILREGTLHHADIAAAPSGVEAPEQIGVPGAVQS